MLKSANVVIGKSDLMQELGKSLDPTSTGTAEEKLNAIAKSFVEAKVAPDMGAALSKASKENPELYREYQVESRNKNKT
jgi:hypothetical protein